MNPFNFNPIQLHLAVKNVSVSTKILRNFELNVCEYVEQKNNITQSDKYTIM